MSEVENKLTIKDIAAALNLSTTTISRALSGNGRVPEKTKKIVKEYCDAHNYVPNRIAQGLALSRTYNIGWVIPEYQKDLLFFQKSMFAICEVAIENRYDVLPIITSDDWDLKQVKRVVEHQKIDGVIIAQPYIDDKRIEYFKNNRMPMVVMGSIADGTIPQVDSDICRATVEFASLLLQKVRGKVVYLGGNKYLSVNANREKGIMEAEKQSGHYCHAKYDMVGGDISLIVKNCMDDGTELFICADDDICMQVLKALKTYNFEVPTDVKVASLYAGDSLIGDTQNISAIKTDPYEIGYMSAQMLLNIIEGNETESKKDIPYEVVFSLSTR